MVNPKNTLPPDEGRVKEAIFAGGGELGERMRAIDWSATPLGPVSYWPQSLKTCIRIILTSRQPMFVWWGDQMINLYNDAYKAIVGGKHPEALGQPASVVWREIWEQVEPRATSAMERNEGTYDESLLLIMERYGYQEETYYTFSYSPVPNDQGGTGGIICANTDNTQRIISERQLMLLRELAASTANARTREEACRLSASNLKKNDKDICFAAIYVFNATKQIFELAGTSGIREGDEAAPQEISAGDDKVWPLTSAAIDLNGIIIEDLGDRFASIPCGSWDHPSSKAALLPIASIGTGRPSVLVVGLNPYRRYDDSYLGFLKLVAGQISASISNAQAYEEEKKRAEALAEIDRAKTTFFSNVSHELRTPLTLMLGPLEDEIGRTELTVEQKRSWELLHRNALRLLKLVNALLDFSRIEAGRVQVNYQATDISEFTAELASVFESAVERAGLRLKIDCPPLPRRVFVDPDMWEKIILNLLSNALKSTFDGEIDVTVRDAKDGAEVIVRDTGTGIPEAEIPRLFERFRRIEGARKRTHEGSGIGLALVNELVQMHGGSIAVQSTLGKGTEFKIHVPYGSVHLPYEQVSAARTRTNSGVGRSAFVQEAMSWLHGATENPRMEIGDLEPIGAPTQTKKEARVLLVDDNGDMREYVQRLLNERFDVTIAENGRIALEKAIADPPDLVLTDVMMPVMDGFQLLNELRNNPKTQLLPVIMLSARAGEESRVEGLQAGADDYLVKPFTARELMARVEAHVKMARLRREFYEQRLELQRQLKQAGDAVEHLTDAFQIFDRDWRITYINPAGEQLVGRSKEELAQQPIWEIFPQLRETAIETECRRAVKEQVPAEFEYLSPISQRWFKLRVYPSPDGGAAVYLKDITEVRKAEEALRKAEQLAVVGRLAASISHELNNPLEAVTNLLFLAKTADSAQAHHLLELADREVRRLSHIASRSLKFYRQTTSPGYAQLKEIIDSVLFFYEPRLRSKSITVERRFDPVPDVYCLQGEMQQVFANLISNALDATETGGRLIISISNSPVRNGSQAPAVRVTVADTGIGMDGNTKKRLFEPFFTTKGEMGTGLGLWVSREILEKHRVDVQLRSKPGRGTAFTLTFPLQGLLPVTNVA